MKMSVIKQQYDIISHGVGPVQLDRNEVYYHGYDGYVIIVENNTTISATAIQRIFASPIIYLWLLMIFLFVVLRCGLQWLNEREIRDSATKRRRCIYMCENTVQLSCGVVMYAKQFYSQSYLHRMLAHGSTIIPVIMGMFISGLLYGEYLVHFEVPNIDSMDQLNNSNLSVCGPFAFSENFRRF